MLIDLDHLLAGVRAYREQHPLGTLPASIIVERNGAARAEIAVIPREGSLTILRAATGAARGFAADSVVISLDGRLTLEPVDPVTGEPVSGEDDTTTPTPGTSDVLMVMRVARDGTIESRGVRYTVDEDAHIIWGEDALDSRELTGTTGFIVDTMRAAFDTPLTVDLVRDQASNVIDPESLQLISDLTTVGVLGAQGHVAALVPTGPEEVAAIEAFMQHHGAHLAAMVRGALASQN